MELPTNTLWTAGTMPTDELLNDLSYALRFLVDPPEVDAWQTSAQTIPTGTSVWTPLTLHSAPVNTDAMWSAGAPTRITINTPGWYEMEMAVHWATVADGTDRAGGFCINGVRTAGAAYGFRDFVNANYTTPMMRWSYDQFFNAGDYLELCVYHSSVSAVATASSTTQPLASSIRMRWSSN